MSQKWALITGVSEGGLGDALAKELLAKQFNIIATGPTMSQLDYLAESAHIHRLVLDVTSKESILAAAEPVRSLTSGYLNILINNAGYGYMTPVLDANIDAITRNFSVNVFGLIAVTQAFFPMLQKAQGIIVNQASIAGLPGICQPFIGSYSASKAAVIDLGNTMRVEFEPMGVKVVTLVTGDVKTNFWTNVRSEPAGISSSSPYWPIHEKVNAMMVGKTNPPGQHPADVWAENVVGDLLTTSPPTHVYRGYLASTMWWVSWLMPTWVLDRLFASAADLGKLKIDAQTARTEGKKDR